MAQAVKPRSRKACFSDAEIRELIDLFSKKKDMLLTKFNSANTNQQKKKAWAEITESVNSRAVGVKRTVEEVKNKWKDLLAKARKDASAQKQPPTGGGPQPQVSPYSDIIPEICGRDSASMVGITNAIESSSASTSTCVDQQQPQDVEISSFEVEETAAADGDDGQDTESAKHA